MLIVIKLKGNLNKKFFKSLFKQAFGETYTVLRMASSGNLFNKLIFNQHEKSFSYAIEGGLFIGSTNEELVDKSINQLKAEQKIYHSSSYISVEKTAGKKVDGNFYINYKQLSCFFGFLSNESYGDKLNTLSSLSEWSELDLFIKKDEFLLSGYTSTDDSLDTYLELFRNQSPQYFEMIGVIPANATLIQHFGLDNFEKYHADYQSYLKQNTKYEAYKKQINQLNTTLKTDLNKSLLPLIGKEFGLISLAKSGAGFEENTFAVIKTINPVATKNYFDKISANKSGSGLIKKHQDYQLFRLNIKNFIPAIFGPAFIPIQNCYYTFLNNYLIVANSTSALENYINLYISGRTLDLDATYISFSDNMAEKSNLFFYFNIKNGLSLLEKFASTNVFNFIIRNNSTFKKTQAIGLQYSYDQNGLFTNFNFNYNSNVSVTDEGVWQSKLDNTIIGSPQLLQTHTNQHLYAAVCDVDNNLYLMNHAGERLWKYKLDGQILSKIYEVDFYKNGKIQYLFNTKNNLYLLDILGRNVSNYPHRFNISAKNGIAVFDYSNDKNYRIIYAGNDKKLHNLNIQTVAVKGWNKTKITANIETEVEHLVANNRDYILLADINGNTRILNRLGNDRILLKSNFKRATNSVFYVNKTNNKGLFLTTNTTGKLSYINSVGTISYTDFGNFSTSHYFNYQDFDGDNNADFIFVDKKKLKIFNRYKEEILNHQFDTEITSPPIIFNGSDGQLILGIYSIAQQEVFLFNKDGKIDMQKISGSTNFTLGDILKNGSLNIVIGSKNSLNNYIIQ